MGDHTGFMKLKRQKTEYRNIDDRKNDYKEVFVLRKPKTTEEQAARCMDCGTPFCHWACPVANVIPEWNDFVFQDKWEQALMLLQAQNNLPEITGRICPALCEAGCVLAINDDPITIRENELDIVEYGFENGLIKANPPKQRTGKKIAIVGSGPAGLAAADQLNKIGHTVTVYEKDDKIGGLLRYGIPDFKLDKSIIDRRIAIYKEEGIEFKTGINVGVDLPTDKLLKDYDAVCLTGGSREFRDLPVEGRNLNGVVFAMDYLIQSNKHVAGDTIAKEYEILAKDKKVVVIGGGDTGNDCVGTANRQGADFVMQIELMPKSPAERPTNQPWPFYPRLHKVSTSHQEGCERDWNILTQRFIDDGDGNVKALECIRVEWVQDENGGRPSLKELSDTKFTIDADLVILAMGFVQPEHAGLLDNLGVEYTKRGNVKSNDKYQTSIGKVFAAGDMRRGQSLVVWAIAEGRNAAAEIDEFLMGETFLPKNKIDME